MRDGVGVTTLVRKFQKRLADNLSFIQTPLKRGSARSFDDRNLLIVNDEGKFLEKLDESAAKRSNSISYRLACFFNNYISSFE